VFCKIEYTDARLSITGAIGPNKWGNARGSCGQIDGAFYHNDPSENDDRYAEQLYKPTNLDMQLVDGWTMAMWYEFLHIWQVYHLNDMQIGCEHQRALGWTNYDEHPSEPCSTCGYKFGSAWLHMDVPQDAIDFLFSLPDTKVTPAWV
jgi:hypothetical protein